MKIRRSIPLLVSLLLLSFTLLLQAQNPFAPETREQKPREADDSVQVQPIPLTEITRISSESLLQINESGKKLLTPAEKEELTREVDSLRNELDLFFSDTTLASMKGTGMRNLENVNLNAAYYQDRISTLQKSLSKRTNEIEESARALLQTRRRWEKTLEGSGSGEISGAIINRINSITGGIDSVRTLLLADFDLLLVQQDQLSDRNVKLELLQQQVSDQKLTLKATLFTRDMPGFFKDLSSLKDPNIVQSHLDQISISMKADLQVFTKEFAGRFILVALFLVAMVILTSWYKANYRRLISEKQFEVSVYHLILIRAPVLSSIFLTTVLIRFIFPDLPHTLWAFNFLLLTVPTLIFVTRMFHVHVKPWYNFLAAVFLLTFVYEFMFFPDIVLRILLMLFSIMGILLFAWMLKHRPAAGVIKNRIVYNLLRATIIAFTVFLAVSIIANLVGAFRLAEFLTLAPIRIFILLVAVFLTTRVADSLVYLLLAGNTLQQLNVVREDFEMIYRKTVRLIHVLLWIFCVVASLRVLRVKEVIFTWGEGVIKDGWKLGAVEITLQSILIFIFVIWLSIVISRIITRILEKDVFARVETAKGVPGTIVMLLRIALISGGFFLAAAAAGMELTNLSIVLGAFSVGIGFGLQNIFNNMVSGLILAFERPIKVGDTVQVGELMGIVLKIGLRSSTVRSFDGAEVIVPNGNLISDQMINWTLSDTNRRMDLRVGVAYGTDPEKVIALLESIASAHKLVDKNLEPKAYFVGFGDSSLDFRLLAWSDIADRLAVESEINVTINLKLKEAGIEIPFPQRDLHLRSDFREKPGA